MTTLDVLHFLAHALQTHLDLAPEPAMKQQIFGRIARQRELRKKNQVGPELRARPPRRGDHTRRVTVHIANQQVELRECNFEGVAHESAWGARREWPPPGLATLRALRPPPADLLFHDSAAFAARWRGSLGLTLGCECFAFGRLAAALEFPLAGVLRSTFAGFLAHRLGGSLGFQCRLVGTRLPTAFLAAACRAAGAAAAFGFALALLGWRSTLRRPRRLLDPGRSKRAHQPRRLSSRPRAPLLQKLIHRTTELSRRFHRLHARALERLVLVSRSALSAGDNRASVAHALARAARSLPRYRRRRAS